MIGNEIGTNRSIKHSEINDLRSALDFLAQYPGEVVSTEVEVDPYLELAGVYRRVGAGVPTMPPTKLGPAMLFENVKGRPGLRMVCGVLASRKRASLLVGGSPGRVSRDLSEAVTNTVSPVIVAAGQAPCQEVVITPPFDLREILPPFFSTKKDSGVFINMGVVRASDPETGESDVTIHRLCIFAPDKMTISMAPGRHIGAFYEKAAAMGKPLPISVSIGLDPAIHMATSFFAPTTRIGFDELTIAGGLRGRPIELVDCVTQPGVQAIARAEIVLECEIRPGEFEDEDVLTGQGRAMPEFPGYMGFALKGLPVATVTGITHRVNPIFQTLVGPGEEHVTLAGLPTEASIFNVIEDTMPGFLQNVYMHPAGGGKFISILQVKKRNAQDEGRQRFAALQALALHHELKMVIVVDEDVDLFDSSEVLWALTFRYQGDIDTLVLPGVLGHPIDSTATAEYNPMIRQMGSGCKTILDCTAPFGMRDRMERAEFIDVDVEKFLS